MGLLLIEMQELQGEVLPPPEAQGFDKCGMCSGSHES